MSIIKADKERIRVLARDIQAVIQKRLDKTSMRVAEIQLALVHVIYTVATVAKEIAGEEALREKPRVAA